MAKVTVGHTSKRIYENSTGPQSALENKNPLTIRKKKDIMKNRAYVKIYTFPYIKQ